MKTRKRESALVSGILFEHSNANATGELVIDNFAGGGGASLGMSMAIGRAIDVAINHDPAAITMHAENHPETRHICENVWRADPLKVTGGRPVGLAWFSPDCKHFSRAKGSKPVEKRIRGLAWIVIKWAKAVRPRVIMLENVREFETWGPLTEDNLPCEKRKGLTFRRWLGSLRNLGYAVERKVLNAADYGAPTHRRRLFVIARCDGLPIVWPTPTHGPGRANPYRTAAECIDWTIPCPSIFDRKRPLAEKTLRRIAMGIKRYVINNPKPFIVNTQHGGDHFRGQSVENPLGAVTGKHGYGVVAPTIARMNHGDKQWNSVEDPLTTITGQGNKHALIAPLLAEVQNAGSQTGHRSIDRPAHTVTANPKGGGVALVTAFLSQYFGGIVGKPVNEPTPTVTAIDHNALVAASLIGVGGRSGQSPPCAADEPMRTITAKADRAIAAAHLVKFRGDSQGGDVAEPMPTVTSGAGAKRPAGAAHAMGIAVSHLTQFRGTNNGGSGDPSQPMPSITAQGTHIGEVRAFLIQYFSSGGQWSKCDAPAPTVTSHDRIGLVTVEGVDYQIVDIGLRMLTPRELARAQGFPDSYVLTGSKSNQVAKIGNSVCPVMADVLARANYIARAMESVA